MSAHSNEGRRPGAAWLLASAFVLLSPLGQAAHAQPNAASSAAPPEPGASPWLQRPNPLRAFLPSAAARAAEQQTRDESLLERRLALLPGVRAVQVRLVLPRLEDAPIDRPLPAARANVLLRADHAGEPSEAEVTRVMAQALPELAPIELTLSRVPPVRPAAPAPSVRVGPFWVAPSSAQPLRVALGACLLSNVVLASLLLLRWRRRSL